MTRYLLQGSDSVRLPRRPLVFRVQGSDVGGPFRWDVVRGRLGVEPIRRPNTMIVPRVDDPVVIALLPPPGQAQFPPRSQLVVTIGGDETDPESDYVQIRVDVSGLPVHELVGVSVEGDRLLISAQAKVPQGPPLGPLAEAARDVTRELLGMARLSGDDALDVVVGIDSSPSMRGHLRSGLTGDVLEVVAGVASVLDADGRLEAVLSGVRQTPLAPVALHEFSTATVAELQTVRNVSGCRTCAVPGTGRTARFFVSDAIPPDHVRHPDVHLVVLGAAPVRPAVDVRRVTSIAAGSGGAATGQVDRWSTTELRTVVTSLLRATEREPR